MLSIIIEMSNGELKDLLLKNTNLNPEIIERIFPIAGVTLVSSMKDEIAFGNFEKVLNIITERDPEILSTNKSYKTIYDKFINSLKNKLSLSQNNAEKVVSVFIPYIADYMKNKTCNNVGEIDKKTFIDLLNNTQKDFPDFRSYIAA